MKKRRKTARVRRDNVPISWLPIDSRLFPFFSFSHVHGIARVFLIIEMSISVAMVIGTLCIVCLRFMLK
jgi:hypothetical protein